MVVSRGFIVFASEWKFITFHTVFNRVVVFCFEFVSSSQCTASKAILAGFSELKLRRMLFSSCRFVPRHKQVFTIGLAFEALRALLQAWASAAIHRSQIEYQRVW